MTISIVDFVFWGFAAVLVALSGGMSWGVAIAEGAAMTHSRTKTAHCIQGDFYYIVPAGEYCDLIKLRYANNEDDSDEHS